MIKVGIFFGGSSREREVSFAGGRTVYDNLDKILFEPIPIFIDSFNNFILLDWHFIYKGSIRDFYPPTEYFQKSKNDIPFYTESLESAYNDSGKSIASKIGKIIQPNELKHYIDFAFLALHGIYGEDGTIQGMLEWYGIPYTGSGILPSSVGMNKRIQKALMKNANFVLPEMSVITKKDWSYKERTKIFKNITSNLSFPFVVKPANQGSSVGVSVLVKNNFEDFQSAINKAFFMQSIKRGEWKKLSQIEKIFFIQKLTDIKEGIGLPCILNKKVIYNPEILIESINHALKTADEILLESIYGETEVLCESFIDGREFSCIVIKNENGDAVALPPTEIVKGKELYDYRSKYLPGLSRKITPINSPEKEIQRIRKECVKLFQLFNFNVYARIDGFIDQKGKIFLNDPNTTSGMMPSSFFFHQAAEIGLNPSQFLTYLIRTSLSERISTISINYTYKKLLDKLDEKLSKVNSKKSRKKNVAVMMGGFSTERHISIESGRNVYEKLSSSIKYKPFPVFVTGNEQKHELYLLPLNMMLKDNADDIKEKILNYKQAPVISKIIKECEEIIKKYGSQNTLFKPRKITYNELAEMTDDVFIALHGRPGEDGQVQTELKKFKIPFNGSDVDSSRVTINKYDTNELLKNHEFMVAEHLLIHHQNWKAEKADCIKRVEKIGFPVIAKPADDGCSSAVKKINNQEQLKNYAEGIFRNSENLNTKLLEKLNLKPKEEFPRKEYFLIEKFVEKGKAEHFLEITGGMLTHYENGKLKYEIFEPSETLAESGILSLEEKFLAGQGQNITPARFSKDKKEQKNISTEVKKKLKEAAKILNIEGYCRIDAFVRIYKKNKVEVIFIEVNSLPGMTPATCIFHQCAINNYKPYEFIDKILNFGEERVLLKN